MFVEGVSSVRAVKFSHMMGLSHIYYVLLNYNKEDRKTEKRLDAVKRTAVAEAVVSCDNRT